MSISAIHVPLYGTVKNFASYSEGDEVFYVFNETKVSDTRYRYEGKVGYGCTAQEFVDVRRDIGDDISIEDVDKEHQFCVPVHFFDSSIFKFEFDTVSRTVDICTSLSMGGCREDRQHIQQLPTIELVMPDHDELVTKVGDNAERYRKFLEYSYVKADWTSSYLRIRFPRTKDEVAAALVFQHMLATWAPVKIRYPLLFNAF